MQIPLLPEHFEVAPGRSLQANFASVNLADTLHGVVVLGQQIQQVVLDKEVVSGGDGLQRELGSFLLALVVDEEGVGAVRTARVESLDIILLEEGGSHLDVDDAGANEEDAPQWLPLVLNDLILAKLYVMHTIRDLFDQLVRCLQLWCLFLKEVNALSEDLAGDLVPVVLIPHELVFKES